MISVITVSYNKPEFIKFQYFLLKNHLVDEFFYTVYNNSPDPVISEKILIECKNIGVECINIPQEIHKNNDPSSRAGESLDYSIGHNIKNYSPKKMIILDSDMFLFSKFKFDEEIRDNDLVGIYQERDHVFYYTNQLLFLNIEKLPNFDTEIKFLPGLIEGKNTDCGGFLYNYIKKYRIKHDAIKEKNHSGEINSQNIFSIPQHFTFYFKEEIKMMENSFAEYFSKFLHFRAGSNWINFDQNLVNKRENILFSSINNNLN